MLSATTLAALPLGERALFTLKPHQLTETQALRRAALEDAHGIETVSSVERSARRLELEKARQRKRAAAARALELGLHLSITAYLTASQLQAFAELARKFAKKKRAGEPVVYKAARQCLADDASVSLTTVAVMRRIAARKGWITVKVQSCTLNEDTGRMEQAPSIYEPGPLMWKAIRFLLRGPGLQAISSVQNFEQTGISRDTYNNTGGRIEADCRLNGRSSYRPASGPDERSVSGGHAARIGALGITPHKTQPLDFAWKAKRVLPAYAPPGINPTDLRDFALRNLAKLVPDTRPDIRDPEKIIAALKASYLPEYPPEEFERARTHKGWYAVTVLLALAANTEFRRSKPIENPGGWFRRMVWHIPKSPTFSFTTLARTIEPDYADSDSPGTPPADQTQQARAARHAWWRGLDDETRTALRQRYARGPGGRRREADIIHVAYAERDLEQARSKRRPFQHKSSDGAGKRLDPTRKKRHEAV